MVQDVFGRVVCVRTPLVDGSGWLAEVWFVAVDHDDHAMQAVRDTGRIIAEDEVIVVGQLEPDAVSRLKLSPGQAMSYP